MYNDNNGFNNQNDINNMNQPNMGMMPNNNQGINVFGQPMSEPMTHQVEQTNTLDAQNAAPMPDSKFGIADKEVGPITGNEPVMPQNDFSTAAQDMGFTNNRTTGFEQPVQPVNNGFGAPQQDMGFAQPQATGFEQPVQPVDNGFGAPQQDMGYAQPQPTGFEQPVMYSEPAMQPMDNGMMNAGYNQPAGDMGMYSTPAYNPEPQPSFNPEPQPEFNNQSNFVPPQYGPQKKDNSGTKFLIGFIIVVGALIAVGVIYWPKISARMKLKGTWECDNSVTYNFNGDKTYTFEQNYLGSTITYSGTYSPENGIKDEYKQYKKDGYNYLTLTVVVNKVEYLNETSNFDQTGTLTIGIKGDEAHIISSGNTSITCKKK
jgi:hypothetical protein